MAGFKDMGMAARSALLAGGAVIAAAAGYGLWSANQVAPPAALATDIQPAPDAAVNAAAPLAADATADTAALAPNPDIAAPLDGAQPQLNKELLPADTKGPTFDLVRVEPDGQALVAGKAAPGAQVVLRLDGEAISATTADAQGNFVVLFVLDPSPVPRMLTMASILPDLSEIAAAAEIALAPTVAATVAPVASAEPAPAVDPAVSAEALSDPAAAASGEAGAAAATSREADAPSALLVTKDGVNLLPTGDQPAANDNPSLLALDTISYTPTGDVQMAGRATAGAFVRIYLDNAPLIALPVGDDGRWASTMPMIAPGLYTLRVDALSQDGTVTARFETPFKRETKDALAAASQIKDPAPAIAKADSTPDPQNAPVPPADTAADAAIPVPTQPERLAAASDTALAPVVPAETAEASQIASVAEPAPTSPASITVQPGFTLWGIASEQFGDGVLYVQVFEANKDKIRDPNLIYPGQVFVIPKVLE